MIWEKYITSWLCAMVSNDGTVINYLDKTKNIHVENIKVCYSVDKEYLESIRKILLDNSISSSLLGPYRKKEENKLTNQKPSYSLRLSKYFPKGKKSGVNQYQVFRNSIEYWELQKYIMKRKYDKLCEITRKPKISDKQKIQSDLI